MAAKPFLSDIQTIRKRARAHMERGAVTDSYTLDRDTVLKLLNEALATEIICVLRYKAHYYLASGINAKSVAAEFLEHAAEEQQHADQIAERITQLDGTPNFSPSLTVCCATARGARIRTRPGTCFAHSNCIAVFPIPQSAKIAARPRRSAHRTISRWKANRRSESRGTSRRPVGASTTALRERNSS